MYNILTNSGKRVYGVKAFMVKTEADIDNIPLLATVAPGSTVIVTDTSKKYILTRDRIWKPIGESESEEDESTEVIYEGGDINSGVDLADVKYEGGEVE